MLCKFKNCSKCNGDLVLDGDEWRCWQCGTYYYPNEPVMDLPLEAREPELVLQGAVSGVGSDVEEEARPRRLRARRRTMTNINSVIMAKERSEQRWWNKNQDIIDRLKQGDSVRDISETVGKGQRQIRGVQERLKDMSVAA
ncbi:MAG: hypothetical protein HQ475_11045 [SAR202 cluster bacterium]|nr:hypothetical protein [SAR202 cluster bacterium]